MLLIALTLLTFFFSLQCKLADPGAFQTERLSLANNLAVSFKALQAFKKQDRTVFEGTNFGKFQYLSHLVDKKTKVEACQHAIAQKQTKALYEALRDKEVNEYVLDPKTLNEKVDNEQQLSEALLTHAIRDGSAPLVHAIKDKDAKFKKNPNHYYRIGFEADKPGALVALAPDDTQEAEITKKLLTLLPSTGVFDKSPAVEKALALTQTYCKALKEIKEQDEHTIIIEKKKKKAIHTIAQLPFELAELIMEYQEEQDDLAQAIRDNDGDLIQCLLDTGHSTSKSYRLSKTEDRGDALDLAAYWQAPAAFNAIMRSHRHINDARQKALKVLANKQLNIYQKVNDENQTLELRQTEAVQHITTLIDQELPKHQAAKNKEAFDISLHYSTKKLLAALRTGANPNKRKNGKVLLQEWFLPLHMILIQLAFGANPDAFDENVDPIIFRMRCQPKAIKLFVQYGANPDARNRSNETLLEYVVCQRNAVKDLLRLGANPNQLNAQGTPIIFTFWNNTELFKLFLDHGADPNARDKNGDPLIFTARYNPKIMKILLECGANLNARNRLNASILEYVQHEKDMVKDLLAFGIDLNQLNQWGAPIIVTFGNDTELFKLFLDHGADPNARDKNGNPLILCIRNPKNMMKLLLQHNVDPNQLDRHGTPIIFYFLDATDMFKLLLDHGADPNARNKNDDPLILCIRNSKNMMKLLLQHNVDPNQLDRHGTPIIFYFLDATDMFKLLLKHGANPNARNKENEPILKQARGENVELLLEYGANPNVLDKNGDPIIFATIYNPMKMRLLLEYGANPNVRNKSGKFLIAEAGYNADQFELLTQYGASSSDYYYDQAKSVVALGLVFLGVGAALGAILAVLHPDTLTSE